jgi:inorganic pyrophosphatase
MPARQTPIDRLPAFDKDEGHLHTIVDTPKGSRNKYKYDEKLGLYSLGGLLPVGASFPFDFGFVPSTLGGDGDPLDVLLLMEEPAFVGCLVPTRLIGVIEAEQTERDGSVERNDRLIGVAVKSRLYEEATSLLKLSDTLVDEIEHFFVSYNEAKGKVFTPTERSGPERARAIVQDGEKRFKAARRTKKKRR